MSRLAEINHLTLGIDGVWREGQNTKPFNYSDGQHAEQTLYRILSTCDDLSSDSKELDQQISDWPTEYHLSSTRANLIRPLDIKGSPDQPLNILELGCGCGSITRYLGELSHVQVDAVEGSSIRAGLAALRCRDQENVSISAANFNDLNLPEAHYDVIFLVGVCEYAGRFSTADSDQQAVIDLLQQASKALNENGVVYIAIENRLGLKYLFGANEDHYAQRYIGLENYPDSTGIRTYSHDEWLSLIAQTSLAQSQFLLPFPDYKIPTTIMRPDLDALVVFDHLKNSRSRDYLNPDFKLSDQEAQAWRGLAQSGDLVKHANSFLIGLAATTDNLDSLHDFSVQSFRAIENDYFAKAPLVEKKTDAKVITRLQAEVTQLQGHTSNLEGKVSIMENSIGWRFLNLIRRLFRRTTF